MYTRSGYLARLACSAQRQAAYWGAAWIGVWTFLLKHTKKLCERVGKGTSVLDGSVLAVLHVSWLHAVSTDSNVPVCLLGIGAPAAAVTRCLAECMERMLRGKCAPLSLCHICYTPVLALRCTAAVWIEQVKSGEQGLLHTNIFTCDCDTTWTPTVENFAYKPCAAPLQEERKN